MKFLRILVLMVAAVAISAVVAACTGDSGSGGSAKGARITIQDYRFGPPITVTPGEKVTVTNKDPVDHNVIADDARSFVTPDVPHGKSVSFTAPTRPGTYTFSCTFHPQMRSIGTLVVRG